MLTDIVYTRGWSLGRKKYAELYSEEHARELHDKGLPYTAVLLFDGVQRCVVKSNVAGDHLSVTHLDDQQEPTSTFGYTLLSPERMEFSLYDMVFHDQEFPGPGHSARMDFNRAGPDTEGRWTLRASVDRTPIVDVPGTAPAAWDDPPIPAPAFGDYERFYRPDDFDPLDFRTDA